MTTKERIEADIKKNVSFIIVPIAGFVTKITLDLVEEKATEMATNLTNLSSQNTMAGQGEKILAIAMIKKQIMKKVVEEIRLIYKI